MCQAPGQERSAKYYNGCGTAYMVLTHLLGAGKGLTSFFNRRSVGAYHGTPGNLRLKKKTKRMTPAMPAGKRNGSGTS